MLAAGAVAMPWVGGCGAGRATRCPYGIAHRGPLTSSHPSSRYSQHFAPSQPASGGQAAAPPRSALPWNSYTSRQSPVCFQHNGLLIIFAYPLYECYQTVRQLPSQPASSESVSK